MAELLHNLHNATITDNRYLPPSGKRPSLVILLILGYSKATLESNIRRPSLVHVKHNHCKTTEYNSASQVFILQM